MSRTFDELFATLNAGGPGAADALHAILGMGQAAVPRLVTLISAGRSRYLAGYLLSFVDVPDAVAMLEPLLGAPDRSVRSAAIQALGRSGDARALQLIVDHAGADEQLAISALGDLGVAEGREPIVHIVRRRLGETWSAAAVRELAARAEDRFDLTDLFIIARAAESLAKLGDFSLVDAACELTRVIPQNEELVEALSVRLAAIDALDVSVGQGVAVALAARLEDPSSEVAEAAARAELHLGRMRVVARWLRVFERPDGTLAPVARRLLHELVGRNPPVEAEEARAWWSKRAARYDANVCYRFGIPAAPARLVLDARKPDGAIARGELRQMIGLPFLEATLSPPPPVEIARLDAWWQVHAGDFPPGKLHRWGRTYAPDACDGEPRSQ